MSANGESLRMAGRSLWSHKLRSLMTILGVVFGIGSVIAVTSLGAAFEASITSQFDGIDERAILVTAGTGDEQGPPDAGPFGLIFTEVDRKALEALPGVDEVAASGRIPITGLTAGSKSIPFETITATTPDDIEVRAPDTYTSGGVFVMGEEHVVLGSTIATLLGSGTPLKAGDVITIEGETTRTATVSGVLAEQEGLFGTQNRAVYAPIDPFYDQQRTSPTTGQPTKVYRGFTVFAVDVGQVTEVQARVEDYFAGPADAKQLLTEDVKILVNTASGIQGQISSAFDQVTIFIAAIAGVSLIVGGIMIATIMLISVTERTKEIGLMKAIGGLDRDILGMFLLEAAIIGLIGSIVGLGFGLLVGFGLVEGLFGSDDVGFIVAWDWVGISVLLGTATGVIAGLIPATRATRVQPVEALSYE